MESTAAKSEAWSVTLSCYRHLHVYDRMWQFTIAAILTNFSQILRLFQSLLWQSIAAATTVRIYYSYRQTYTGTFYGPQSVQYKINTVSIPDNEGTCDVNMTTAKEVSLPLLKNCSVDVMYTTDHNYMHLTNALFIHDSINATLANSI